MKKDKEDITPKTEAKNSRRSNVYNHESSEEEDKEDDVEFKKQIRKKAKLIKKRS